MRKCKIESGIWKFIILLTIQASIFMLPASTLAQSFSLGIYPPITHVVIQPGKETTLNFKITNTADPTLLSSTLVPFTPADEFGGVKLIDCERTQVLACEGRKWFSFTTEKNTRESFFINSGETQTLSVGLKIPQNALSGDYPYSLLLTAIMPNTIGEKTMSKIIPSIGSNIIVTVSPTGQLNRQGKIVAFSPLGGLRIDLGSWHTRVIDSFDDINLVMQIENNGQTVIEPTGEISLSSPFFPISRFSVSPGYILPKSMRTLLTQNTNSTTKTLSIPRSIYFGKYVVKAQIAIVSGAPPITVSASFWAFPFKLILLCVVAIIVWLYKNKRLVFYFIRRYYSGK